MARATVLARLTWRPAILEAVRAETATARTLTFTVPGWSGHRPGQHVDLRLTAPDGYTAVRPYSIGSAASADTVELTIESTPGGEVSPFLVGMARPGVTVELRGPLGGWFVWSPERSEPVQLVAGGSGVVPLMSMLRTHRAVHHRSRMRLLYSVRTPAAVLYARELSQPAADGTERIAVLYSRQTPTGHPRPARRLDAEDVAEQAVPATERPLCYVCGPTPFVETAIGILLHHGHDPAQIRAERFGAGRT